MQFIDAYTYNLKFVGARTTGNNPQEFLIAGPDWEGYTPPGIPVFQSKTDYVFLFTRTRTYDAQDAVWVADNIQPKYKLTGYESGELFPRPKDLPPFLPLNTDDVDPRDGRTLNIFEKPELFVFINFLLQYMDTYEGDQAKMDRYSKIGIGPGVSFTPTQSDQTLYYATWMGVHAGYKLIYDISTSEQTKN